MLGTIVNCAAIIAGSLVGALFKKGIPDNYNKTVMHALGLATILIGIKGALGCDDILVVIISLAVGTLIGEFLGIENGLESLGKFLETRLVKGNGNIAKGFVTATLIYCVGSMAIVGSIESGLTGNHDTLFAKATLDGIASIIFTSSLGIGVIFSAVPVLLYQGSITLMAGLLKPFLIAQVVSQMTSVGGLLIVAIG
ncbi:MAG: DUF554 domain-containing protein, partial [Desulfobacteraceae bacterium]|nr:DUF554 domain-containing protein [Desulfobacteraceae bacterium]